MYQDLESTKLEPTEVISYLYNNIYSKPECTNKYIVEEFMWTPEQCDLFYIFFNNAFMKFNFYYCNGNAYLKYIRCFKSLNNNTVKYIIEILNMWTSTKYKITENNVLYINAKNLEYKENINKKYIKTPEFLILEKEEDPYKILSNPKEAFPLSEYLEWRCEIVKVSDNYQKAINELYQLSFN